ncbi:MAG: tetratricopeptide repeat protein [Bryobacteraceae bacterium]|nr:tetratricopeptide repeat protein [Bryobacteraceae bacterium]
MSALFVAAVSAAMPFLLWEARLAEASRHAARAGHRTAETALTRALALAEHSGSHSAVAVTRNNLGSLYQDAERYAQAEQQYRRSLAAWDAARAGAPRPGRLRTLNNLATLYIALGQPERAARLLPQSAPAGEEADLARLLANLGACAFARRRYPDAQSFFARSLAVTERLGLPVESAVTRLNLAVVAAASGKRGLAEEQAAASIIFLEANLSPSDPLLAQAHLSAAEVLATRPAEAERHLRQALTVAERSLGPDSDATARALAAYAALLKRTKRKHEANLMARRAAEIRRSTARHNATRHTIDWSELSAPTNRP